MRFFTTIELNYQSLAKVEMLALELLFRETKLCRNNEEYIIHRLAEIKLGELYNEIMEDAYSSQHQQNDKI